MLEQAAMTPNIQAVTQDKAILGGRLGFWDSLLEDSAIVDFWKDGKFTLGDFNCQGAHLALSSSTSQSESAGGEGAVLGG